MSDFRCKLLKLFRSEALEWGEYVLASGETSPYYIDGRRVTLSGEGVRLIAEVLLDETVGDGIEVVGGMSIGADPIIGATIALSAQRGRPLAGFMVRKKRKPHGTQRMVEGPSIAGKRALIVEDVITTGGSTLRAIDAAEAEGAKVARVIALVDRQVGARKAIEERGYPFSSVFSLNEILGDTAQRAGANSISEL